jgi:hypothetical protein
VNRDDIIRMAREVWSAGEVYIGPNTHSLERFAELVAAAERESCAKVCDEVRDVIGRSGDVVDKPDCWCAAAIRARLEGEQ